MLLAVATGYIQPFFLLCTDSLSSYCLYITMLYTREVVPIIVKEDLKYIAQYVGDGRQLVTEILVVKRLKLFVDN